MNPRIADRLARVCGMLGSDFEGERASAGAMTTKIIRESGLTWHDVFAHRIETPAPESLGEKISLAIEYADYLSDWERKFVRGVVGRTDISAKQKTILNQIVEKCCTWRAAGGGA